MDALAFDLDRVLANRLDAVELIDEIQCGDRETVEYN